MKTLIFAFRNYVKDFKKVFRFPSICLKPSVETKNIFFNLEIDNFLSHNQQLIISKSFNCSIVDRVIGPSECSIMETKIKNQNTQKFISCF